MRALVGSRVKLQNYRIGICCLSPKQHTGIKAKTGWLGISIMCPSGDSTFVCSNCVGLMQVDIVVISLKSPHDIGEK